MNKKSKLTSILLAMALVAINETSLANKNKQNTSSTSDSLVTNSKDRNTENKDLAAKDKIIIAETSKNSYLPYLQFWGSYFFNVDASSWGTGLDFFVPLWQSVPINLVFTQIRVFDRSGKPFEGNIHLGYRYLSPDETRLHGIYAAFDRKHSAFGNYFNQLTFGVETQLTNWFIGGSFYQPIGKKSKPTDIVPIEANAQLIATRNKVNIYNILVTKDQHAEKAAFGGDAEVGYEFLQGLTLYAGGYYFKAKYMDTIIGPKARLSYNYSLTRLSSF